MRHKDLRDRSDTLPTVLGLVLAAGASRRLRPYTDSIPKALAAVDGDTTILDITLGNFSANNLTDVVVIVGYRAEAIVDRKKTFERDYGITIEFVLNKKAEEWNNAYSLWCARDYFVQGVLLANGDTVHPASLQAKILANHGDGVTLAVDQEKPLADEEMKIQLDSQGYLSRITKNMDPATANGEYMGVSLIQPAAADELANALQATFERDPHLYYEDGYQEMVDRGTEISISPIGTVEWVEVDNHDDLARAREIACRY